MQTKTCAMCGENKTPDKFYIQSNRKKDGTISLRKNCKACQVLLSYKYWDKTHPDGTDAQIKQRNLLRKRGSCPPDHKWCFECDAYLHINLFAPSERDGRGRMCHEHKLLYMCARSMEKKKAALEYCGGAKCSMCGYTGHFAIYDFHHKEPSKKEFDWGHYLNKLSLENAKKELDKCQVLCRNCHTIVHSKLNDDGSVNLNFVPKSGDPDSNFKISLKKYKGKNVK